MSFNDDPELQELFKGELSERAERLVEGALVMQQGEINDDLAGAMLREGHTIKGTGRVMGFEAISRAGQLVEQLWRRIQHGDVTPTTEMGVALEQIGRVLPASVTGDPLEGTPELAAALSMLQEATTQDAEPQTESEPTTVVEEAGGEPPGKARSDGTGDLGGLLGALEDWATAESVLVNAGRLYRLINHVAAIRLETEAVRAKAFSTLDSAERKSEDLSGIITDLTQSIVSLEKASSNLERQALELAAVPLSEITNTVPQLVRYLAKKTGKEIRFELVGDELAVDRQVLERISDPIRQLIVNSVEHGIESPKQRQNSGKAVTAMIALRASIKDHMLEIVIEDDGAGIEWTDVRRTAVRRGLLPEGVDGEPEALRSLLFAPGFSTAIAPSELVGDGTGLTTVSEAVDALFGSLRLDTVPGEGTTVTMTVPTSRALQQAVLVVAAGQTWGVPEAAIDDVLPLSEIEITTTGNRNEMMWRDRRIPVASFAEAVGLHEAEEPTKVVILASPVGAVGLTVAKTGGSREVASKELGPLLAGPTHVTGAALLGGDDVVLLVDASRLAERARDIRGPVGPTLRVLVVDDSQGVRQVVAGVLASNGYATKVASSVSEALEVLHKEGADALVVDFAMPNLDGIALVNEARRRYGDMPIVMMSAVATFEDQQRAETAGVDAFFDKSDFREGALAETIGLLLAEKTNRSEVVAP